MGDVVNERSFAMASPPAVHTPGTADRILDAAAELFAERGFAGTAIRDISARVGITPASLYNHFDSKTALYEAVLERGLGPIIELLDEMAGDDEPVTSGYRILTEVVAHLAAAPSLAGLLQHEILSGGEHLGPLVARWIRPLYEQGLAAMKRSPDIGGWQAEELPLLLMAYHHILFGHFALAPAMGGALGEDLLSPQAVERQTRFLHKLTDRLLGSDVRRSR